METWQIDSRADLVESIMGEDPLEDTRRRPVVDARIVLAVSLFNEGKTENEVARLIGWDRCSVHHYRELYRDAVKYGNRPEVVKGWEKLKKIIDG